MQRATNDAGGAQAPADGSEGAYHGLPVVAKGDGEYNMQVDLLARPGSITLASPLQGPWLWENLE